MAELTLVSPSQRPLQPLVEGALQNELRLLEAGIRRSEQRLQEFEIRYGPSTADFIQRYGNDELGGCPRITPNASLGYVESCGSCVMPSVASTLSGKRPLTPTRMAP
jgi:hypothetical protein